MYSSLNRVLLTHSLRGTVDVVCSFFCSDSAWDFVKPVVVSEDGYAQFTSVVEMVISSSRVQVWGGGGIEFPGSGEGKREEIIAVLMGKVEVVTIHGACLSCSLWEGWGVGTGIDTGPIGVLIFIRHTDQVEFGKLSDTYEVMTSSQDLIRGVVPNDLLRSQSPARTLAVVGLAAKFF